MKTLLVATDFSNAARNALAYSAQFAKHIGANIILFHAYQRVLTSADMVVMETTEEVRDKCIELLQEEVDLARAGNDVELSGRVAMGNIMETILENAKRFKADYIIVGMKGSGKTVRKIFGSTATGICRQSNIPVIAVPEQAQFAPPKNIALASDISEETDMHILDPLLVFGKTFNSQVYVVRVTSNVKNEMFVRLERGTRLKWHLQTMNPQFEFLNDNDVAHALQVFVQDHNINMLTLIGREHNFFEKLFLKSVIKEMLFQTHVPLLILPDRGLATASDKLASFATLSPTL